VRKYKTVTIDCHFRAGASLAALTKLKGPWTKPPKSNDGQPSAKTTLGWKKSYSQSSPSVRTLTRTPQMASAQILTTLPPGLRAMAATHWLDVSLTLDSITWHFGILANLVS